MKFHFSCALIVAASVAGPVAAQTAAEPTENVTVFAPYVVKKDSAPSGVQAVTISREVSYHDLDLTKDGDVAALEKRVNQAAKDICGELDSRFSVGTQVWKQTRQDRECVKNASGSALVEARAVVAAVRGS